MSWDDLSTYWQAPLAGACGGVVRAIRLKLPLREALTNICVGAICAVYLNPLGVPLIEKLTGGLAMDEASKIGLSGFAIGMGGLAASTFVMDMWKRLRTNNPRRRNDQ